MKYNTAIFYDIENLIGGYNISNVELLINLSLKQIMAQVKQKNIGKIAIQRAYADWSAPRLNQLKADMVELGIEPKQMTGTHLRRTGTHLRRTGRRLTVDRYSSVKDRYTSDNYK